MLVAAARILAARTAGVSGYDGVARPEGVIRPLDRETEGVLVFFDEVEGVIRPELKAGVTRPLREDATDDGRAPYPTVGGEIFEEATKTPHLSAQVKYCFLCPRISLVRIAFIKPPMNGKRAPAYRAIILALPSKAFAEFYTCPETWFTVNCAKITQNTLKSQ